MTIFLGGDRVHKQLVITKVHVWEQNYHFTHKNYNNILSYEAFKLRKIKLLPVGISSGTY